MNVRALTSFVLGSLTCVALIHCSGDDAANGGDAPDGSTRDATSADRDGAADSGAAPDATTNARDASDGAVAEDGSDAAHASDAGSGDSAVTCSFPETSDGVAHLLAIYTLPPTSMKVMVPYLTSQNLSDAITNGAVTVDNPGPGSGLEYVGGCTFLGIGDRGPNGSSAVDKNGTTFPLPAYTPTVMRLRLDPAAGALLVDGVVNFAGDGGAPVTGLPNDTNDDVPYATADASTPMAYVQAGLDTEDVRRLPNGDLAFSEEYAPSVGIVDGTTGRVKVRYVPSNVALPLAGYPVQSILPPIFAKRRLNKGFEGLALSADGHTAYAVLQTPMGDEATYGNSLVNRVVRIEHFDDPAQAIVTGHFVVLHQPGSAFGNAKQSKVFYNSALWLSADKLLLLERGPGHLHLVVADFAAATNLVGKPALGEADLSPESVAADAGVAALGITPASTTQVFDSDDTPSFITSPPDGGIAPDKLEGLALVNRTTVAIANDNDFGIVNAGDRTRIWIVRLKSPLPN